MKQAEALDSLVNEFTGYAQRFISSMETYKNLADTFAEMSQPQISAVWDSVAAMDAIILHFIKAVKAERGLKKEGDSWMKTEDSTISN